MTGDYELLEHTADVGIRATGATLAEAFAAAAEGLAALLGAWFPGEGEPRELRIEARDRGGLLVAWLDELLYLNDTQNLVFGGFEPRLREGALDATVAVAPAGGRTLEGVGIKAATYHRLRVEEGPQEAEVVVYLDL